MGGVIVDDEMERQIGRGFGIEMVAEGQPLVVRVVRRGLTEDLAVEIGEGGSETIKPLRMAADTSRSDAPALRPSISKAGFLVVSFIADALRGTFGRPGCALNRPT